MTIAPTPFGSNRSPWVALLAVTAFGCSTDSDLGRLDGSTGTGSVAGSSSASSDAGSTTESSTGPGMTTGTDSGSSSETTSWEDTSETGDSLPEGVVVARASTWHYFTGAQPPADWQATAFDHTNWPAGPAPLGYELSNATIIDYGPDPDRKYISAWFRHGFDYDDSLVGDTPLVARVRRDDGAAVYLNGIEILRTNLDPDQVLAPDTVAASDVEGVDGQRYYEFFVERSMLRAGANVLAAQVHQSAADSPDLTFDFELVDYLRDLDKTTFRVRTRSQDHNYAPANCGAIWIEDEFGAHVRTLKVWADRRLEHLVHWRKSIGAYPADDEPEIPVDALSGATLDAHATHKVDWDGRDFLGQFVPHGAYRVQIEVTEDNANDREHQFRGNPTTGFEVIPEGALYSVAFAVGDAAPTHIVAADTAAALEFMAIPGSPPAGDPRPSACPGYCEHIASCQLVDPGNCMTSCAPEQIRALLHSPQCDTKVNELLACASALDCDALALFVQGVEPNPCAQLQAERDGPLCRVPGASLRLDEPFLADRAGTKQPRLAVVLDARPNSVVSVPVGVTPVGEITLTPSSLTFTPDNWNIPQFVTGTGRVTGSVGDVRVTVELGASASLDPAFDGQKWGGLRGYIAD